MNSLVNGSSWAGSATEAQGLQNEWSAALGSWSGAPKKRIRVKKTLLYLSDYALRNTKFCFLYLSAGEMLLYTEEEDAGHTGVIKKEDEADASSKSFFLCSAKYYNCPLGNEDRFSSLPSSFFQQHCESWRSFVHFCFLRLLSGRRKFWKNHVFCVASLVKLWSHRVSKSNCLPLFLSVTYGLLVMSFNSSTPPLLLSTGQCFLFVFI